MASHLDPVEENVLRLLESAEPIDFSGEVWHQIMAAGDVRLMIWCQEEGYTGDERLLSWAVSPVVVSGQNLNLRTFDLLSSAASALDTKLWCCLNATWYESCYQVRYYVRAQRVSAGATG